MLWVSLSLLCDTENSRHPLNKVDAKIQTLGQ